MTTALEGVSGQQHALAALYLRERHGTHFTGGWVGPRAGLDGRKISSPPGSIPDRPARSRYTDWATRPTTLYMASYICWISDWDLIEENGSRHEMPRFNITICLHFPSRHSGQSFDHEKPRSSFLPFLIILWDKMCSWVTGGKLRVTFKESQR